MGPDNTHLLGWGKNNRSACFQFDCNAVYQTKNILLFERSKATESKPFIQWNLPVWRVFSEVNYKLLKV